MSVSYALLNRIEERRTAAPVVPDLQQEYVIVLAENGGETRELIMPRAPDIQTLARIAPNAVLAEVRVRSNRSHPDGRDPFFAHK